MVAKHIILLIGACLTAGGIYSACEQTPEKKIEAAKEEIHEAKQDIKEALKDAQTAYRDEWHTFQFDTETKLRENEYHVNELKESMVKMDARAKATFDTTLAVVEQRNESLKKQLAGYKDEGKEKWGEFKEHVTHDMGEIEKSLEELTKKHDK